MNIIEFKHSLLDEPTLLKLKSSGINSVNAFLDAEDDKLSQLTTLSGEFSDNKLNKYYTNRKIILLLESTITVVKNCFRTMYENYLPVKPIEYQQVIQQNFHENRIYQTGISAIDERIKGLTLGSIMELVGKPERGKTKLCMTIAINFLVKYDRDCYWIDTKMDFSSIAMERAMRHKFETRELSINAMKKLHVQMVSQIQGVIEALEHLIENEKIHSGLLVLDSLSAVMCECVWKRYRYGRECLTKIVNYVRNLCTKKDFIAIITVMPKKKKRLRNPRSLVNSFNRSPDDGWNGRIDSLFREFASERFLMKKIKPDQKLINIDDRNSNKRLLIVKKSISNNSLIINKKPIQVYLTDEGVV